MPHTWTHSKEMEPDSCLLSLYAGMLSNLCNVGVTEVYTEKLLRRAFGLQNVVMLLPICFMERNQLASQVSDFLVRADRKSINSCKPGSLDLEMTGQYIMESQRNF